MADLSVIAVMFASAMVLFALMARLMRYQSAERCPTRIISHSSVIPLES